MTMNGSAGRSGGEVEPYRSAEDARRATLALLDRRAAEATVCPSEVARALAAAQADPSAWRDAMPTVHAAVDRLVDEGLVRLSWKGETLVTRDGPYRIGRGTGA